MEAFFSAVRSGELEKVATMVSKDPGLLTARDPSGALPVQTAVYHRQHATADWLKTNGGVTDLYSAAVTGDTGSLRAFADTVDLDDCSPDGFTALALASAFASTESVRILLTAGASPHVRSRSLGGVAPLHAAVFGRNLGAVEVLLEAGADPDSRQEGGFTPLMGAAQNGDAAIAALLIAHGADRDALSDDGKSARDLAAETGLDLGAL